MARLKCIGCHCPDCIDVRTSLESQLAQVTAERDEVRDEARERQRKLRILITYWRSICRAERRRLARIEEAAGAMLGASDEMLRVARETGAVQASQMARYLASRGILRTALAEKGGQANGA